MSTPTPRILTGWHVLAMFVGGFAVIIAVNLTLAYQAIATFPGLETRNSYVSSQSFDRDRAAQDALGWDLQTTLAAGQLRIVITDAAGQPVRPARLEATLGRGTHVAEDRTPDLQQTADGYVAQTDVAPGSWVLWLDMTAADGTAFRRRIPLIDRGEPAT